MTDWLTTDLVGVETPTCIFSEIYFFIFVLGGWIETGTKCGTSKRLYFYNLKCHTWVSEKVLTSGHSPNSTGAFRYSHSVVKKDNQTLLFLGGYDRINVLGDLISYKVPKTIVYINETTSMIVYGQHCSLYDNLGKYFLCIIKVINASFFLWSSYFVLWHRNSWCKCTVDSRYLKHPLSSF